MGLMFLEARSSLPTRKIEKKKKISWCNGGLRTDRRDHACAIIHNGIWCLAILLGMERIRTYDFGFLYDPECMKLASLVFAVLPESPVLSINL
jgi:hypothetical protein